MAVPAASRAVALAFAGPVQLAGLLKRSSSAASAGPERQAGLVASTGAAAVGPVARACQGLRPGAAIPRDSEHAAWSSSGLAARTRRRSVAGLLAGRVAEDRRSGRVSPAATRSVAGTAPLPRPREDALDEVAVSGPSHGLDSAAGGAGVLLDTPPPLVSAAAVARVRAQGTRDGAGTAKVVGLAAGAGAAGCVAAQRVLRQAVIAVALVKPVVGLGTPPPLAVEGLVRRAALWAASPVVRP